MKFDEMTATQIAAFDRDRAIVIVPIAAVEQHGPHMPTGTDTIICAAITSAVESVLSEQVVLMPTVWLGASSHHLRYGATIDVKLKSYIDLLCDIAGALLRDGFQRVLFVNGHGGNVDPMRVAMRQIQLTHPDALLVGGSYWSVAADLINEVLQGDHKYVGHACEFETSMMLHLRPDLVNTKAIANAGELVTDTIDGMFVSRDMWQRTQEGFTGRPDLATADKGQRLFAGIVIRLRDLVVRLLSEPIGTEYEDFVTQKS